MARATYPEETKAAVMAALLAGQSISTVAEDYKLPVGTVKGWSRVVTAMRQAQAAVNGQSKIGDLVLSCLEAQLAAIERIITLVSQDPQWIGRQSASELAVFVGVLADKSHRTLTSLPEPEGDGGGLLAGGAGATEAA